MAVAVAQVRVEPRPADALEGDVGAEVFEKPLQRALAYRDGGALELTFRKSLGSSARISRL